MAGIYHLSLNEWLDFFGFKASPFSKWEAEEEARLSPDLLSVQWVKPACFDRVLGQASEPRTVLLFAPRGAGKTACRILVEYYCTAGLGHGDRAVTGGQVLSVLHTRFDEALRESGSVEQVDEYWHAREILRQGVESLCSRLMVDEELVQAVNNLDPSRWLDLQWFLSAYPPVSISKVNFLQESLGLGTPVDHERRLGYGQSLVTPLRNFTGDNLLSLAEHRSQISPIDQLYLFVDLVCGELPKQGLGFEAVYILVDGLDEFLFSADLTNTRAVELIFPLLANLRLMNAGKFAFKFFLPIEIYEHIRRHPAIRHDRLIYETIRWSDADMHEILHRRLAAYGPVQELDILCAPELRGMEEILVRISQGNPRRLMRLCEFMLQAHLSRPLNQPAHDMGETAYLLTQEDWQEGQARFADAVVAPITDTEAVLMNKNSMMQPEYSSDFSEEVLHYYPGPIALVYLDYLHRQEAFARLSRLLDLFEVTAAFVGIILLSQLRALVFDTMSEKLKSLRLRLGRMSIGGWLTVWEKVPGLCNSLEKTTYATQLQRIFTQEHDCLDGLRILRNQTLGHGATVTEMGALELLAQYEPDMMQVLRSLAFLRETRLLQVQYIRKTGSTFEHRARVLVGDNPNFPWCDMVLTQSLESDKIVLYSEYGFLDLNPFLLFKRCQADDPEDIFIYQQLEESAAQYISYGTGHLFTAHELAGLLRDLIGA